MKLNWGTGIALTYAAFVAGMVFMVFASRKHDPGLVRKDYYALDLNYQQRLDGKQNAAQLANPPKVSYLAADKQLTVQFPDELSGISGKAKLYRSATVRDDFSVDLEKESTNISTEKMAAGRWHIELEWESGSKKYYWETTVYVS